MASRNHLVSDLRTDKTGKQVLRWVKPGDDAAVVSDMPAPIVADVREMSAEDQEAIIDELWTLIRECDEQAHSENLTADLNILGIETVSMVLDYCNSDEGNISNASKWVAYYSGNSKYVRELVTYAGAFSPQTDADYLEMVVEYVGDYDDMPDLEDYSAAEPELKEFISEVLAITDHLYSDWFDSDSDSAPRMIEDESLVALLFEYPKKASHIRQVMKERETEDVELIRQVITSPVRALSEGAL